MEKDWLKQPPLFSCCGCADEYSWPKEDLAMYENRTYCGPCWEEFDYPQMTGLSWFELPPFKPMMGKDK